MLSKESGTSLKKKLTTVNFDSTMAFAKTYWLTMSENGKVMLWKDMPYEIQCAWNGQHIWTASSAGWKVPADLVPDELTYKNSPMKISVESFE